MSLGCYFSPKPQKHGQRSMLRTYVKKQGMGVHAYNTGDGKEETAGSLGAAEHLPRLISKVKPVRDPVFKKAW